MRALPSLIAFALLAVSSGAAASWSVHGSVEPDTSWDAGSGRMWQNAPDGTGAPIYFDVVANAGPSGQNPNEIGTRLHPPATTYGAFLGVWRDCSHDGFIGLADGALMEYSTTLLDAQGADECPDGSMFNRGGWVYELLPIGPADANPLGNADTYQLPRLIDDRAARIWGDAGAPDGAPAARTCPLAPLPKGATSSSGALLSWLDCAESESTRDQVDALDGGLDVHTPLVSPFGDPSGGRHGALEKGTNDPSVTVWDCSDPKGGADVNSADAGTPRSVTILNPLGNIGSGSQGFEGLFYPTVFYRDPSGGPSYRNVPLSDADGSYASLPAVAPGAGDPQGGSYYDAVNATELGAVEDCNTHKDVVPLGYHRGTLLSIYTPPEDAQGVDPRIGRAQNDIVFDFTQNKASNQESGTADQGAIGTPAIGDLMGTHETPQDFGVSAARFAGSGPGWIGSIVAGAPSPIPADRAQLANPSPPWATFYAQVIDARGSGSLPTDAPSTYGSAWCPIIGNGAPAANGWSCDPSAWWRASAMPTDPWNGRGLGARVGESYRLLDVDCWDDRVVEGIYAGPEAFSNAAPCS